MDMKNKNASSRMRNLFIDYRNLLCFNSLAWLLEDNQRISVQHVLSAMKPSKLRSRLESDLAFSQHHLKKNFNAFFKHAQNLSDAFQLVDSGVLNEEKPGSTSGKRVEKVRKGANNFSANCSAPPKTAPTHDDPVCLGPPHAERGISHRLKDCRACPDNEKKELLQAFTKDRCKVGPSRSTRGQLRKWIHNKKREVGNLPKAGRLKHPDNKDADTLSFPVAIGEGIATLDSTRRCEDGRDDSINSPRIA